MTAKLQDNIEGASLTGPFQYAVFDFVTVVGNMLVYFKSGTLFIDLFYTGNNKSCNDSTNIIALSYRKGIIGRKVLIFAWRFNKEAFAITPGRYDPRTIQKCDTNLAILEKQGVFEVDSKRINQDKAFDVVNSLIDTFVKKGPTTPGDLLNTTL